MKSLKFVLFLIGSMAAVLLGLWSVSLFIYVFGSGSYPGTISYMPKYIFVFTVFVFLYKDEDVKITFDQLGKLFFGEYQ